MRNYEDLISGSTDELDLLEQEDRCRRVLRTVGKAMFMRLFVTAVLIFALVCVPVEGWVIGLMVLVLAINFTGILRLLSEWKKQRAILRDIIAKEDV